MQYDMTKTFLTDEGEVLQDEQGKTPTIYSLVRRALLTDVDGKNQPINLEDKDKNYDLYLKVRDSAPENVELSADEVNRIITASKVFTSLVAGQIRYFLNQKV
jgi:hypothetical protein